MAIRFDGRVAIVSGLPGIGKTRLAAELAGEVAAAGLRVHHRCRISAPSLDQRKSRLIRVHRVL